MARTVWKQQAGHFGRFTVMMPAPARVVHFGLDPHGVPCVWVAALTRKEET